MKRLCKPLRIFLFVFAIAVLLTTAAFATDYEAGDFHGLYAAMQKAFSEYETEFSVTCSDDMMPELYDILGHNSADLVRKMGAELPNPDGSGADVQMLSMSDVIIRIDGNTLHFEPKYLLNKEKSDWTDTQIGYVLEGLNLQNDSDYMKIKKIYQYVGTQYNYDHTYTYYTDYDAFAHGTMVCQGYALLTYKLMWRAGIPCRILVGQSMGEAHGWNAVKLDGKWYCIDTTWDAAPSAGDLMYWNYFLKSEEDFEDHDLHPTFANSAAFRKNCPISAQSYSVPSTDILCKGEIFSGLTIRNGQQIQLDAVLTPKSNTRVIWKSTDDTIVSVDENGLLDSLTPGFVQISATPEDKTYTPGVFPVTAVDLRTCSAWADEELNSFYLRGFYPADMCSDYQQAITREDLAYLISLVVTAVPQESGARRVPEFKDIEDSVRWYNIIYCTSRGIFGGTGEKTFSPKGLLTRQQMAKLLCSILDFCGVQTYTDSSVKFSDFEEASDWAKPYILRAASMGLMQGSGGKFNPNGKVSREQAALMLERLYVNFLDEIIRAAA